MKATGEDYTLICDETTSIPSFEDKADGLGTRWQMCAKGNLFQFSCLFLCDNKSCYRMVGLRFTQEQSISKIVAQIHFKISGIHSLEGLQEKQHHKQTLWVTTSC